MDTTMTRGKEGPLGKSGASALKCTVGKRARRAMRHFSASRKSRKRGGPGATVPGIAPTTPVVKNLRLLWGSVEAETRAGQPW